MVQLPVLAVNVTLFAFAAERRAAAGEWWDGRTDRRTPDSFIDLTRLLCEQYGEVPSPKKLDADKARLRR